MRAPHQAHFCSPPHLAPALAPYPPPQPPLCSPSGHSSLETPVPQALPSPKFRVTDSSCTHTPRYFGTSHPKPRNHPLHIPPSWGHAQRWPLGSPRMVPGVSGCPFPPRSRHRTLSQAISRPGRAQRWDRALQGSTCSPAQLPTPPSQCRNHPDCSAGRSDPVLKHIPAEAQSHPGE